MIPASACLRIPHFTWKQGRVRPATTGDIRSSCSVTGEDHVNLHLTIASHLPQTTMTITGSHQPAGTQARPYPFLAHTAQRRKSHRKLPRRIDFVQEKNHSFHTHEWRQTVGREKLKLCQDVLHGLEAIHSPSISSLGGTLWMDMTSCSD